MRKGGLVSGLLVLAVLLFGCFSGEEKKEWKKGPGMKNMEEGQKYLAANKKKEGVEITESGLQYEILRKGEGPRPGKLDKVTVHYRGTLISGKEFDSSYDGKPVTFPLNRVISGWQEGVQLMPVGSKFRFVIPPSLAYQGQSAGLIGPNSTLIFEIELFDIVKEG